MQRESFDVIGKVGFGQDFQASKDIDNPVNTFRLMTDNMEEGIRRIFYPFRKYSRSKVTNIPYPRVSIRYPCSLCGEHCCTSIP